MNRYERAAQTWSILAWAARHQQTITYQQLSQATGMFTDDLDTALKPIQAYCRAHQLPPLTILVVEKDTGLPSQGFNASQAVQVASDHATVFMVDWLEHGNPQEQGFRQASGVAAMPLG